MAFRLFKFYERENGTMTEYLNSWRNCFNFTCRTSRSGYWTTVLIDILVLWVLSLLYVLAGGVILNVVILYCLARLLPRLSLAVRRLRDGEWAWYWVFLGLVPILGQVILLVLLCSRSVEDNVIPQV